MLLHDDHHLHNLRACEQFSVSEIPITTGMCAHALTALPTNSCALREMLQIERVFSQMKAWLRRYGAWADQVPGFVAIDRALRNVTTDDCLAYIRKSGDMYTQ